MTCLNHFFILFFLLSLVHPFITRSIKIDKKMAKPTIPNKIKRLAEEPDVLAVYLADRVTCIVDDTPRARAILSKYRFFAAPNGRGGYYAATSITAHLSGRRRTIRISLQDLLVGFSRVRHLDGDTLNNRAANLGPPAAGGLAATAEKVSKPCPPAPSSSPALEGYDEQHCYHDHRVSPLEFTGDRPRKDHRMHIGYLLCV